MFNTNLFKKITAILIAVIGLVVIILGATLMGDAGSHSVNDDSFKHNAGFYSTDDASFGADFYTYMYKASDMMVDELNDINAGVGVMVQAQNALSENVIANVEATEDLIETVGKTGGIITIAIGLAIMAYAVKCAGVAFAPADDRKVSEIQ